MLLSLLACKPDSERLSEDYDIYKVICQNSVDGCSCYISEGSETVKLILYHAEAVKVLRGTQTEGRVRVTHPNGSCYYPAVDLLFMSEDSALKHKEENHYFPGLNEMLEGSAVSTGDDALARVQHRPLGYFWPTYYHLAKEQFHPGEEVAIINGGGTPIGRASRSFLEQVKWEGSGVTKSNQMIRYAGKDFRFEFYSDQIWGHGAGYGYTVYPYRTIAVNFDGICHRLKDLFPDCSKKDIIGMLVYIAEVDKKEIAMENGFHDGYFCVTDTGSPYYIRSDRIDIFTGLHWGGNPYLPENRQSNLLIEGGIENLVPSDWRLWESVTDRVWCQNELIPADPFNPTENECTHDYHVVAAHKALNLFAVSNLQGEVIRCKKNLGMMSSRKITAVE